MVAPTALNGAGWRRDACPVSAEASNKATTIYCFHGCLPVELDSNVTLSVNVDPTKTSFQSSGSMPDRRTEPQSDTSHIGP